MLTSNFLCTDQLIDFYRKNGRLNLTNNTPTLSFENNDLKPLKQNLAIHVYKDEILKTISQNRVTIISGETSSGKSTQVENKINCCYLNK